MIENFSISSSPFQHEAKILGATRIAARVLELVHWGSAQREARPMSTFLSTPFGNFLAENQIALSNAACLLGGARAEARCWHLVIDLTHAMKITRRIRGELLWLEALLSLELSHIPDSIEAACANAIPPDDPRAEDICLLLDTFREALTADDDRLDVAA